MKNTTIQKDKMEILIPDSKKGTGEYTLIYQSKESGEEDRIRLSVYEMGGLEEEFIGKKQPLGINWSARGTQSVEATRYFIWFLDYVCDKVEALNEKA